MRIVLLTAGVGEVGFAYCADQNASLVPTDDGRTIAPI